MTPLGLGDLVDLEARALEEAGESEERRRSRYRQLGQRLLDRAPLPEEPGALLKALLELDPQPESPGRRFEATLRLFHVLLALLGLLAGGSLSLGLLHTGGPHPVNVLTVLAALVGTQLVLLGILILAMIPRSTARSSGPVQHLLQAILARLGAAETMKAVGERLDAHRGLLRWVLVRAAQVFGVAFNVGALAGCLYRIAFTDIAFGWSTTFRLDAESIHRLAAGLAAPWSWLVSRGVPSPDLVQLTQYSHLEGKYVLHGAGRSMDAAAVGDWWPFLLLAVAVYGLLPRILALATAGVRIRGILAETPRRNDDLIRLCDWMRAPVVLTRVEGPEPERASAASSASVPEPALPPPGSSCEVLTLDADLLPAEQLDRILRERFGWTVSARVAPRDLAPGGRLPLVVTIPAWEEPTKGRLRRLGELRAALADRLLLVGLFHPAPTGADLARRDRIRDRWRRDLPKSLEGLLLRVEPLP